MRGVEMGEVVKDSSVVHVVSHYCVVDEVVEHPLGGPKMIGFTEDTTGLVS